jgi:hypothetical protein
MASSPEAGWAHAVDVVLLLAAIGLGLAAAAPRLLDKRRWVRPG